MMSTRQTTIILEVQDRFGNALKSFTDGVKQSTDALKKMADEAGKTEPHLSPMPKKLEAIGTESATMGDKLQKAFGGSSRAVNVFGNAVTSAVGATGPLSYTLDVLVDSGGKAALMFGGLTTLVLAGAEAWKFYSDWVAKSADAEKKAAEARAAYGKDVRAVFAAQNTKTELDNINAAIDETTRRIVAARSVLGGQGPTSLFETDPTVLNELLSSLDRLIARRNELTSAGYVSPEQIGGLLEFTNVTDRAVTATENLAAARRGLLAQQAAARQFEMQGGLLEFTAAGDQFVSKFEAQSRAVGPRITGTGKSAGGSGPNLVRTLQQDAARIYKSLVADSQVTAQEIQNYFTDAYAGIVEAQAQMAGNSNISLIGLQQNFADVFAHMSQDSVAKLLSVMDAGGEMAQALIAQLYQIAAAGGSAAEMANAITEAINRIPTNKVINIRYNVMGMGGPGGNQQGDEWMFTLEGESYAVRNAYMQQYGDYGRANEAWQAAHRAELAGYGVTGPGQANTRTGVVYPNAFGAHEVVSSPRMMLVGERGPERIDITPGTAPRMGGNAAKVEVSFNSLVPHNEYQAAQAAAVIKRILRNSE